MGDDAVDSIIYAINKETGESFAVGGIVEVDAPEIAHKELDEKVELEVTVKLKTIKKKRFIKLLMAKGYQRNQAIKMHEEYMNKHEFIRSRLGLEIFVITYKANPNEIKVFADRKDVKVNAETNNM